MRADEQSSGEKAEQRTDAKATRVPHPHSQRRDERADPAPQTRS